MVPRCLSGTFLGLVSGITKELAVTRNSGPRHQETSNFWETALRKKVRKASTGTCPSTSNQPNLLSLFWWSKSVSHMCQKTNNMSLDLQNLSTVTQNHIQISSWHDWHGHRHLCFSGSLSIAIGFSSRSRHWQSEHVAGHLLNTLGKSDQIWDGQCVQDLLSLGRISKNCRPSSNELCSGAFQSSNFVLSLHTLFMWCCPRSKPIHHATGDPRNQKSCCLSAVSHRAHLLRGYFAAPESAGKFFTPKPLNVGVVQQLWQRIWDPNMFTQEVCNHSLPVGKFFKGWR